MAIVLARLYGVPVPAFEAAEAAPALRERLIVLHGTDGLPAARDIETRMHELGLATVQVTDYRNLAHGRHVGLSRNAKSTTIVALTTASSRDLAEKTLAAIPKSVDVVRLDSGFSGGTGAIDLLRQVLPLPNVLAALAELDPAKPIVPPYGRRLYHLPFLRLFPSVAQDPVEVKLRAAGADPAKDQAGEFYSKAYSSWRKQISQTKFTTVILDYDGTCVETGARWSLPTGSVQHSLLRLLEEGVRVVFASGRGDSLYRDLRKWVPESVSDRVLLGLHNGAWMQELADDLRAPTETHPAVARAGRALLSLEEIRLAAVRCGWTQVSVVPVTVAMSMRSLRELVEVTIPEEVRPQLRIMSSAHSVDIVPVEFGKAAVLRAVEDESGMTLAIGDQGGVGGNDYDLLHLTTRSVTVDVTSPDPTRCWPISLSSTKGPSALTHLLDSFELREGGFRFAPPRLKDARVR
ncbi:HAD family hydrolase [Plantibacter sp. CFBP 8775]|uniref:HAD family hydrolase n=1 Tax=Plantibacter sp. CFBP 8775 TaxID=2774038 RepID=UPI00177AB401|nr:hypothetical protein [Plantibacter sp. CFBP 8775]MBD8103220.1 hypothetical protein [Plantibacter sp. CFBP 8775]